MSIQPPQGILTIPNATLRVGRLQVDEVKGFDTVLNTFDKNTILEEDSEVYDDDKKWGVKMPNIFVATFEIKGAGSSFNFRNTSMGDAGVGYTLTFSGTTLTLKYDDSDPVLATATIPNLDFTYGKVYLTYEKQYFTVTVDGTRVLAYKDDVTRTPPDGEYINFFAGTGSPGFKNLKVVAGHLISDGTSNVSLYGGLAVTSNLEVGSSNLFVDTVNSRVGVGTTTPEATLHVSGNAYVSSNLEVGSSNLFVDTVNSRVGVGTDTPKESLDVVGNMHLTRVSNVSQIKVDSNVVTEYTGPHDRPLRKYPEVAMTANSDKGYVVTRSSIYSGNWEGYKAFNEQRGTNLDWLSAGHYVDGVYDKTNGDTGYAYLQDTSGVKYEGEWITLHIPKTIRLKKFSLVDRDGADFTYRLPKDGALLGSNDGTNWELMLRWTNRTFYTDVENFFYVNTDKYYSHFGLVGEALANVVGAISWDMGEIKYYGYEEGSGSLDTTLKSVYNVPATTGTQLEVYYDAKDLVDMPANVTDLSPNSNDGSVSGDPQVSNGAFTFDGTGDYITNTRSGYISSGTYTVSTWVNISKEASGQTNPNIFQYGRGQTSTTDTGIGLITSSSDDRITAFVYGNNDFIVYGLKKYYTWIHLTSIYELSASGTNITLYVNGNNVGSQATSTAAGIGATPHLSIGVQANASDLPITSTHFNGSIANFRLFSKALNAGQVQELYDYQKDYFLGSKSQVTLYKGHLGIGVTEPSGQLELAGDERIQQYPPRGMTGYETLIPGHGVFCVSASTDRNSTWEGWEAFDGRIDANSRWISADTYAGTEDAYNGTARLYSSAPLGEYVILKLPYSIKLSSARVYGLSGSPDDNNNRQGPERGQIWGSNDGVTWEHVTNYDFGDYQQDQWNEINNINSMKYYSQYGFIVTKKLNNTYTASGPTQGDYVAVTEIQYFGTPGPTTLDKGSLSLGRSLDVPRVSRYDVDTETPRPEKLVVDFDTTVNSTPTDISGKGNHGTFYNMASKYLANEKAFTFDGTDDHISTNEIVPSMAGAQSHTMSVWFKPSTVSGLQFITCLGEKNGGGAERQFSAIRINGSTLQFWTFSNDLGKNGVITAGVWHHAVAVYVGGATSQSTMLMYLNGEKITNWDQDTTDGEVLGFVSPSFAIGEDIGRSGYYFAGQISNPKLYNVALEPSEVQKLYRLGRTGRSMVISDTAVGIGKVPEAQLDVRGVIKGINMTSSPAAFSVAYNPTSLSGNQTIIWNLVYHNVGDGYNSSDGFFTAPVSGYYHFTVWGMTSGTASGTVEFQFMKNGSVVQQRPYGNAGGNYGNATGSIIEYLNIGNTMSIFLTGGTTLYASTGQSYNGFSGFYLSS